MELIKIHKSQGGRPVVSGRDLHGYLGVKTDFTDWIKRMFDYGLTENVDYAILKNEEPDNQRNPKPKIDYALTLDSAKEISMLQRSEKGKQARLYFINCEKKLLAPALPATYSEALRELAERVEQQEKMQSQIELQKPAVEFFNAVTSSKDALPMADVAKVLDMNIGRNDLFKLLRESKILMINNTPYQEFIDRGYFRVVEQKYSDSKGEVHISTKTLVYQKGMQFIKKTIEKNLPKV